MLQALKRRIPKLRKYPIWSAGSITAVAIVMTAATIILVAFIGKGSLISRAEITAGSLAGLIFLFLTYALYTGGRVRKNESPPIALERVGFGDVAQNADASWMPDIGFDGGGDDGCLGVIIGIVLTLLVGLLLILLVWILANLLIPVLLLVLIGVWWVMRLALRLAFAKSRTCRGNLSNSLGYAFLYTLLYTGWLFLVLAGARWWVARIA